MRVVWSLARDIRYANRDLVIKNGPSVHHKEDHINDNNTAAKVRDTSAVKGLGNVTTAT